MLQSAATMKFLAGALVGGCAFLVLVLVVALASRGQALTALRGGDVSVAEQTVHGGVTYMRVSASGQEIRLTCRDACDDLRLNGRAAHVRER